MNNDLAQNRLWAMPSGAGRAVSNTSVSSGFTVEEALLFALWFSRDNISLEAPHDHTSIDGLVRAFSALGLGEAFERSPDRSLDEARRFLWSLRLQYFLARQSREGRRELTRQGARLIGQWVLSTLGGEKERLANPTASQLLLQIALALFGLLESKRTCEQEIAAVGLARAAGWLDDEAARRAMGLLLLRDSSTLLEPLRSARSEAARELGVSMDSAPAEPVGLENDALWAGVGGAAGLGQAHYWLERGAPHRALRILSGVADSDPALLSELAWVGAHAQLAVGKPGAALKTLQMQPSGDARHLICAGFALARLGRSTEAAESLEAAFHSGANGWAAATVLASQKLEEMNFAEAEYWASVAAEDREDALPLVRLRRRLTDAAVKQARENGARGDWGSAESLLELAQRHARPDQRPKVLLERAAARERWLGQHHGVDLLLAVEESELDQVVRFAVRRVLEQLTDVAAEESSQWITTVCALAPGIQSRNPEAVWPYALLGATLLHTSDLDGAVSAVEAGIAAATRSDGSEGSVAREQLYTVLHHAHQRRYDFGAAGYALGRGVEDVGLTPRLLETVRLLARVEAAEALEAWQQGFAAAAMTHAHELAEALRKPPVERPMDRATPQGDLAIPVPLDGPLPTSLLEWLGEPPCSPSEEASVAALASRVELERTSPARGGSTLAGDPEQRLKEHPGEKEPPVPDLDNAWTVVKMDKASDGFDA